MFIPLHDTNPLRHVQRQYVTWGLILANVAIFVLVQGGGLERLPRGRRVLLLGGNGGVTWAEQFVPSGVAALIVASTPMWMVLLDAVRLRAWPRPAVIAGLALGLVGIWLLVGPSDLGSDPVDPVGALAVGAAAFFWAVGSIYQRGAPKAEATLLNVGMQMLAGGALLLLAGVVLGERLVLADVSAKSAGALAYLVFFGAIVGYSAYVWLLKVSTPAKASTYAYVNPIVAVLLGWALADEPLGPRVLSASLAVVAAVATICRARRRFRSSDAVWAAARACRCPSGITSDVSSTRSDRPIAGSTCPSSKWSGMARTRMTLRVRGSRRWTSARKPWSARALVMTPMTGMCLDSMS